MWRNIPLFGLFAAISLSAQEVDRPAFAQCAQIDGELARLDCYDGLARELDLVPTTTVQSGAGEWRVSVVTNPIDDSRTITAILAAESGRSTFGDPVGLVVRCRSGELNVYLNWSSYLGREARVTSRVGSQEANTRRWSLSTDAQASFLPGNQVAVADWIRALASVDRFVAQVTPYNSSPITAVFDVTGAERATADLLQTCGR